MPRDIPVGNGNVLVAFDKDYILREFFFPHVGEENHTMGEPFRFGVWVNGKFSWIPEGWRIRKDYLDETLITNVELVNDALQVRLLINDLVDFHQNIYLKKIEVENLAGDARDVRLFFAHDFHISGNEIGDTAAFRPEISSLLHYKGDRYFLINIFANQQYGIEQFATGNKETGAFEGTWRDAEDGLLSGNPIAQGSIDSVVGIQLKVQPKGKEVCYYWICVGKDWEEVKGLNEVVKRKTPEGIFIRTKDYWKLWVEKEDLNYALLPEKVVRLYKRSLLVCRTQINNCGSIIAANDSDVMNFNRDTYSYMWPRDGAIVAHSLDLAGYYDITRQFYNFCSKIISKEGFFLHKYNPSGSLASSWHPWMKEKKFQIPIQEDETGLVIWALWHHYEICKDIEFIKPLYRPLVKKAGDFMLSYRDPLTGLPLPSYDLWEERHGILTFTVSAVYAGLMAAAHFTEAFGEVQKAEQYRAGAKQIRDAMDRYLYLPEEKRFARMIVMKEDGSKEMDKTIDASLYALFAFDVYPVDDEKVKNTLSQVFEKLWVKTSTGGLARYENDSYYRISPDVPGNPWFVTTLWMAQYHIAIAKTKEELAPAMKILEWVADHSLPSGVLAEQVNPYTGEPLSVSPLTWSHATYITAVQEYLDKLLQLEKCQGCGLPKYVKKIAERGG